MSPNTVSWDGSKMPDRDCPNVCLTSLSEAGGGLLVVVTVLTGSGVLALVMAGAGEGEGEEGLGLILILCLCFVSAAGLSPLLGSGLRSGTLTLSTLHSVKHSI